MVGTRLRHVPFSTRLKYIVIILAGVIGLSGAHAQTPAEFYKGKQVSLYIGFSAGGTYDLYGRVVARHLGKHIPGNPAVVPRNMEGAGSIRLTNFMYTQAPKDGTALATIGRGGAFGPLFGMKGAQFEAEKFLWLGSANDEVSLCAASHLSGIKSFEDVQKRELVIAATGPGDESQTVPTRLERDDDFDRARRDAGALRLLLGQHEKLASAMARGQTDQHPGAALLSKASGAAERAARRRSRQDARAETDDQPFGRAAGDGAPVLLDA